MQEEKSSEVGDDRPPPPPRPPRRPKKSSSWWKGEEKHEIVVIHKDGKETTRPTNLTIAESSVMDCSGNFLRGQDGAEIFQKIVSERDTTVVTHLKCCNNRISSSGVPAFVKGLANNFSNVKFLELEHNLLGLCCDKKPAASDDNAMEEEHPLEAFVHVFDDMKELKTIRLGGNHFGQSDMGSKCLAQALDHSKHQLAQSLQFLYLSSNQLHESSIQYLIEPLTHFGSHLLVLDLNDNGIGAKGAEGLAKILDKMPNLLELQLSRNRLGDEGVAWLVEPLRNMTKLRTLDLSHNEFGSTGATSVAEILTLVGASVSVVNLSHNNFGEGSAAIGTAIVSQLKKVTQLNLSCNKLNAEQFVRGLQQQEQQNTEDSLVKLLRLNLAGNHFGAQGISCLGPWMEHLPNLRSLDLSHNDIGPAEGLSQVASIMKARGNKLFSLNLASNGLFCEADESLIQSFLEALATTTNLMTLDLSSNDIQAESGNKMLETMKESWIKLKIKSLDVSGNPLGYQGIQKLSSIVDNVKLLHKLNLSNCQLGQNNNNNNETLSLHHNWAHVKELDLSSNQLGVSEESMKWAMHAITTLPSSSNSKHNRVVMLTKLDLSSNSIGGGGGLQIYLEQALQSLAGTLTELQLAFNHIGQHVGIYHAISGLKSLTVLNLSGNALGEVTKMNDNNDDIIMADNEENNPEEQLASALGKLEELKYLNLSSNQLGQSAFQQIFRHALNSKTKLNHLNLDNNQLGDCAMEDLETFGGIIGNKLEALNNLDISSNGCNDSQLEFLRKKFVVLQNQLGITIQM